MRSRYNGDFSNVYAGLRCFINFSEDNLEYKAYYIVLDSKGRIDIHEY